MTSPMDRAGRGARLDMAHEPLRPRADLEAVGEEARLALVTPPGLIEVPEGSAPYDTLDLRRALCDRLGLPAARPPGPAGFCPHCGGDLDSG